MSTPSTIPAARRQRGSVLMVALMILIVLTLLAVIALFWKVRKLAALLLLPYLAWVCFAALLNYEFLRLNPDAEDAGRGDAVERVRIGN